MHNNFMAAGSRDRPPMLAKGRYLQWWSRFLRYIDTRPNGEALRNAFLAPEWSRFVTIVKQQHKLDEVSYHKLFDILKQYQKEVNELRAERIARNANPLALVTTAQANQDPYYQTSKSHKSYAPSSKPSIPTRTHTSTRYKGKEIAKPITPASEIAFEEDNDPEEAQRDKDMQKNLALIAKYFKKIYKPTNNNLRTSSNLRNKNMDTTTWYKNENQSGQFGNQRTVNVAGAREHLGSPPKRVKDSAYHKEKMLLYKQAEQGVPLQSEQYDWLADTDAEIDEQEWEAHYSYMAKIQEVPTADIGTNSEPLEQVQNDTGYNVFVNDLQHSEQSKSISNTCLVETDNGNVIPDSPDMCDDDIQNDQNNVESDDERVALANLIANLKIDVDENRNIQKQLKKANTTLAQELKECKTILAETSKTLRESNSVCDSCLIAFQNKQTEFEKYKALLDRTVDYDKLERKLNETLGQLALKDIEIKEGLKTKAYEISVVKEKHGELIKQSLLTKSHYEGLVKQKIKSGGQTTQIDYLLVRRGDLKACKDCRAFPGRPRILWKNLNWEAIETFRATVVERLAVEDISTSNADQMWNTLAFVMKDAAKDSLATKQSRFKDLLSCSEGNQEDIDRAKERYKVANREAKIAVAKAKDKAYEDLYKKLDSKEGVNEIYKISKARERRRRDIGNVKYIKDERGCTIVKEEDIRTRWGEYFSSLFNKTPPEKSRPEGSREVGCSSSPAHFDCYYSRINHKEVRATLQKMGRNKAVGPDQIPIEAWRGLGEEGVKWLTCIFNKIFSSAKMPDEWRLSEVIPVYKNKGDAQACSNYRGIKLLSHTMKLWERVIERRLRRESRVSENHFGFMPGRSTTEAIHLLRSLIEKYRERQRDLHMAFLDLEKAYDSSGGHNTQIDYLLVCRGDLKACKDCRAFPGRPRILWKNLNWEAIETFRATVVERLTVEDISTSNADQMWNTLAFVMKDAAKDSLGVASARTHSTQGVLVVL
nr:hypothetical protein [Tanacetum cinerariifolium]